MSWESQRPGEDPGAPDPDGPADAARARALQARRVARGWTFVTASFLVGLVLAIIPVPYVIEQPGPVFNTLGTTTHQGAQVPMISVSGAPTYQTSGTLDMLTVGVVGTPTSRPSWAEVVGAWFDPSRAVLPVEAIYPGTTTAEQSAQRNQLQMVNSQQDAIAAALTELGYPVGSRLTVASVADGTPASGVLRVGDVVTAVNGTSASTVPALRDLAASNGTARPASVTISRGGQEQVVEMTPVDSASGPVFGVTLQTAYDFPIDVTIQLDNVGGPSAGMMFALGIIDTLTPGDLNGGKQIAGTGTIAAHGAVGPIGGIRQKMYAALGAGAQYFLAPSSNCDEVVGHVPAGLRVFSVSRLSDSLAVLDALRTGSDLDALPTCS